MDYLGGHNENTSIRGRQEVKEEKTVWEQKQRREWGGHNHGIPAVSRDWKRQEMILC